MAGRVAYVFYLCRDCDIDFLLAKRGAGKGNLFCPKCGENLFTEKVKDLWLERPFQYKRSWTTEEDEIILSGRSAGYSHKQIQAALTGRTYTAVMQRYRDLKKRGLAHGPNSNTCPLS